MLEQLQSEGRREFEEFWAKKVGKSTALKDKIDFEKFLTDSLIARAFEAGRGEEREKILEEAKKKNIWNDVKDILQSLSSN